VVRISVIIVALLSAVACARPSEEDCQRICWKAAEMAYWNKVEEKLAAEEDPDEKLVIKEEAEEEWKGIKELPTNPELMRCVISCQKDARPKQVKCIDDAKDHAQVTKCLN